MAWRNAVVACAAMSQDSRESARVRWAQLRFSIIGTLLTSPPKLGELKALLRELAKKPYTHPTRDDVVYFAAATIERWYYRARETDKPIVALERKVTWRASTSSTRIPASTSRRSCRSTRSATPMDIAAPSAWRASGVRTPRRAASRRAFAS